MTKVVLQLKRIFFAPAYFVPVPTWGGNFLGLDQVLSDD